MYDTRSIVSIILILGILVLYFRYQNKQKKKLKELEESKESMQVFQTPLFLLLKDSLLDINSFIRKFSEALRLFEEAEMAKEEGLRNDGIAGSFEQIERVLSDIAESSNAISKVLGTEQPDNVEIGSDKHGCIFPPKESAEYSKLKDNLDMLKDTMSDINDNWIGLWNSFFLENEEAQKNEAIPFAKELGKSVYEARDHFYKTKDLMICS